MWLGFEGKLKEREHRGEGHSVAIAMAWRSSKIIGQPVYYSDCSSS